MLHKNSQLRIIAGKFRGRKIFFNVANTELRPTLNRVRETLFNWLTPYVVGAHCLDLFAGSGIFSFEALSRGAKYSLSVEQNYDTYQNIITNKANLSLDDQEFHIIHQDALLFLQRQNLLFGLSSNVNNRFNIVFLDPPYNKSDTILLDSLSLLINNNFLQAKSKIYFECDTNNRIFTEHNLPKDIQLIKSCKAGKVYFYLAEYA